jgi:uncharacterized protein (TIGR02996 family)
MTQLDGLLQAIVEEPAAPERWLILADWLEEHDDPRRAELLRLHRKLLATCCELERHPERAAWQARLVNLLEEGVQPCVPRKTVVLGKRAKLSMTFALIPPGSFLMGTPEGEEPRNEDEVQHKETVASAFWMGIHPVTQAQWRHVMKPAGSRFTGGDLPAVQVSWHDCQKFCARLGEKFRLPTEAEWEWACRAGTTTPFFFGDCIYARHANYQGTALYDQHGNDVFKRELTPVGSFLPNAWGLYDLHGNVHEWCEVVWECYPGGQVLRGGSWSDTWRYCRSASRFGDSPRVQRNNYGCRVVLSLD